MTGLRAVVIAVVLTALFVSVGGHNDQRVHARHAHPHGPRPDGQQPRDPPPKQIDSSEEVEPQTTTAETTTTAPDGTALERAHWCRLSNGTYLPLGHTFMNSVCSMCQCTSSRAIRCQMLDCLPTYCIDNTMPVRKEGFCCAQCAYEVARNSCVYNGMTFQHGVVIKSVENKMQCWCQLGNIECRNYIGSVYDSLDLLSDTRVVYIIVIILAVVLIFGFLICVTCTFAFYYYYQRYQHTIHEAYDQYVNGAGWQPMNEEEQTEVDEAAAVKQFEAEQYQAPSYSAEMVPPPYSSHTDSYAATEKKAPL